jgi:hypothetical protein
MAPNSKASQSPGRLGPGRWGRGRWATLALLAGLCLTGCAATPNTANPGSQNPGGQAPEGQNPGRQVPARAPEKPPVTPTQISPPVLPEFADLGPEILLPRADSVDAQVAKVGDLVLRQSHAFARLLSAHPKLALSAVDLLVFDVLVARHAEQHGVRLSKQRVEQLAMGEERELRRQVKDELVGVSFQDYIWRLFGMREQDWQVALRLRTAQRLYQGYVLRYLALREDRVQVRFLVHKDKAVAQEVHDKVQVGADFATLALRYSEDASRREGGLLPAFGRGFQHPAATPAFDLKEGDVCAPFEARWGEEPRWFVVYCLEHRKGRDVPFEAVRKQIDTDLEASPVTPLETTAYTLRWRNEEEQKAKDSSK